MQNAPKKEVYTGQGSFLPLRPITGEELIMSYQQATRIPEASGGMKISTAASGPSTRLYSSILWSNQIHLLPIVSSPL